MRSLLRRFFSRKPKLLLKEDFDAFLAVVKNPDAKARVYGLHTFDDMMVCEALRWGLFDSPAVKRDTADLYSAMFLRAEPERRSEIYDRLRTVVSTLGGEAAGAFVPFIQLDPDMTIVATATVDYVNMGSLIGGDPMSRPKDVVDMIDAGLTVNAGAVIGGLLALGDPRVCELLAPLRPTLDAAESRVLTMCYPGRTTKCVVEFYLDWAEELVEREDYEGESIFGDVAAGLRRLGQLRKTREVFDGLRTFPASRDKEWLDLRLINFDEFARSIADRLYELEQREPSPKILPVAIEYFGLKPRSRSQDVATMLQIKTPFYFSPRYH